MCLFSKSATPLRAEKDMVCYKCIQCIQSEYFTPYQCTKVDKDVVRGKEDYVADGDKDIYVVYHLEEDVPVSTVYVRGGYVHTMTKNGFLYNRHFIVYQAGLIGLFKRNKLNRCDQFYKCIIPKGTSYFVSKDGLYLASDRIRFKRRLTRLEIVLMYLMHRLIYGNKFIKKEHLK